MSVCLSSVHVGSGACLGLFVSHRDIPSLCVCGCVIIRFLNVQVSFLPQINHRTVS